VGDSTRLMRWRQSRGLRGRGERRAHWYTRRLRAIMPSLVIPSRPKLSSFSASTPAWKNTSLGSWRSSRLGSHSSKIARYSTSLCVRPENV
jgi:hypothetical protein